MNGVLELIPEIVLYDFVALAAGITFIVVWMVWRHFAPPGPGQILGHYEIQGFHAGGNLFKRIEGRLVDATEHFFSPDIAYKFKQGVLEDVDLVLQRSSIKDKAGLEEARKWFKDCNDLTEMGRVLVAREKLAKHVLVQYGNVEPISNYVSTEEDRKFSFGFGFESKGTIHGDIYSFPQPWEAWKIGKCQVHLFRPYNKKGEAEEVKYPEELAKMMLYAPLVVENRELRKSKDRQLEQKDHIISKLTEENERLSALADTYKSMLSTPEGEGEGKVSLKTGGFGIIDVLLLGIPFLIGYYLADYLGYDILLGVVGGLIAGVGLVYLRLRR
jgi:hypothetical protein